MNPGRFAIAATARLKPMAASTACHSASARKDMAWIPFYRLIDA